MSNESKRVEFCQDMLAARVAQMLARRENITPTGAIRKFMATKTYGLLLDSESYMHSESAEYILYMYDLEQCGDWELWTTV